MEWRIESLCLRQFIALSGVRITGQSKHSGFWLLIVVAFYLLTMHVEVQ